jgi:WD40 repeat protein
MSNLKYANLDGADLRGSKNIAYKPIIGHSDIVWSVAISSDNKFIVSGSFDKTIRVWEIESGT